MRRGGLTRWVHHLGITLVILELAHIPLPAPESHAHRYRSHPGEACAGSDHPLLWRWASLDADDSDNDEALDLAAAGIDGTDRGCCGHSKADCDLMAAARARPRPHFVRGHSKGHSKSFAGPSTFVGAAVARADGFHPAANDRSKAPRASMLQRWRC